MRFSVQPPEVAPGAGTIRPPAAAQSFIARRLVVSYPAGHLTCISTASSGWCASADSTKVTFGIDAAGRHASQVFGGATTTYAYLGTSSQITSTDSGSTTTYSAIDAIGDRLAQGSPSAAAGYLIADLHGNVVAAVEPDSSPAYLNAFRYDAYGKTCGSWHASAGSLTVPWRFQGRMLESSSASPATDLYDFGARSYDPSLGAFTSFDSVSGSAQNPLTLNRYLYANATPATLVDPSGHWTYENCPYGDTMTCSCAYQGSDLVCQRKYKTVDPGTTKKSATPTKPVTPKKWDPQSLYNFCMWKWENGGAGGGVDSGQADTLCQADVSNRFDPKPAEDTGAELEAAGIVGGAEVVGAVLGVGLLATLSEDALTTLGYGFLAYLTESTDPAGSPQSPTGAGTYDLPDLSFNDANFGAKTGKHASEFGYDPKTLEGRTGFKQMIRGMYEHPDEVRIGDWFKTAQGGEPNGAWFIRQGDDVVILRNNGEFWTILKGGANEAGRFSDEWGRATPVEPRLAVPEPEPAIEPYPEVFP